VSTGNEGIDTLPYGVAEKAKLPGYVGSIPCISQTGKTTVHISGAIEY